MRRRNLILLVCLLTGASFLLGGWLGIQGRAQAGEKQTLLGKLELFSKVIRIIQTNYVEEVSPGDMIEPAIEGMLWSLDPHSTFLNPDEHKELRVGTRGEFGGLGIQIGIRDEVLTVISPLEGTPAQRIGILAGDRIVKIEEESTKGITLKEAVKKLRGKPGTQVTITVQREGVGEPLEFTITREVIKIKAIPYYGVLRDDIGYVRLATFSKNVDRELQAVIDNLKRAGMDKLVLDLRNNSGGLLRQARGISDHFLAKGRLIVSTRGRIPKANKEYYSKRKPIYGEGPLVVLTNQGSASASEIVAGAIQDWDRGLILGTLTFGKGSVQTLIPLGEGSVLKLTTAKWYTPSGRCIDKARVELESQPDTFFTIGKRTVYGGGGITPDLELELPRPTQLWSQAYRHFFGFAVSYTTTHKDIGRHFQVTPEMLEEFKKLLWEKEVEFTDQEFLEAEPFIKTSLKLEIAEKLWGTKGRYEVSLPEDPQIEKAIELLSKSEKPEDIFVVAKQELEREEK